jgi:hypothetical protein
MTKINVIFADETPSNVIVHTGLSYEMQPVAQIKVNDQL